MTSPENIGIQGTQASYHEMAARELYPDADIVYGPNFGTVLENLKAGNLDRAVLAIANNRIQLLKPVFDELVSPDRYVHIVGETYMRIDHALMAPIGSVIDEIYYVHSQAPALGQCASYLAKNLHQATLIEEEDTAGSAELVAKLGDKTRAAIASRAAAELYELQILDYPIQDDPDNITRFIALEGGTELKPQGDEDKTTMILRTPQVANALAKALSAFGEREINLSSIQSSIIPNSAFDIMFFLEAEAGLAEPALAEALDELKKLGYSLDVVGTYKRAPIPISERARTL